MEQQRCPQFAEIPVKTKPQLPARGAQSHHPNAADPWPDCGGPMGLGRSVALTHRAAPRSASRCIFPALGSGRQNGRAEETDQLIFTTAIAHCAETLLTDLPDGIAKGCEIVKPDTVFAH
jgi:hypothetical protein